MISIAKYCIKTRIITVLLSFFVLVLTPLTEASQSLTNCNEPSSAVTASDSSQINYFKTLYAKGMNANFNEFMHLWYPERRGSTVETYFLKCQSKPWSGLVYTANQYLKKECSPDVLYSWGSMAKVKTIQSTAPDGKPWTSILNKTSVKLLRDSPMIYATISPVATYQYGLVPIRFKLKKSTPIFGVRDVGTRDGVVTYYDWGGNDFYFLKGDILENWSFGTPEHYDEMVRDIQNYIVAVNGGIAYDSNITMHRGLTNIFNMEAHDGHSVGEQYIKAALLEMIRMILSNEGRIYYNEGSCRNRQRTFQTDKPTYFTPFKYDQDLPPLPVIKILEASYGLNLDVNNKNNGTKAAAAFCDSKTACSYKVHTKFLGLPRDTNSNSSFDISWSCGSDPQVYSHHEDPPSKGKVLNLTCPSK